MLPSGPAMAQASHQPGHIVPRPKHRKSLTKTSLLNRQNLAHAYKSTLLCLKAEAPSITDEYFRTHFNVQQILFRIYICTKSPRPFITSYFSSSSALYWLWLSWFCWDTEQWTETLVSFIVRWELACAWKMNLSRAGQGAAQSHV